jgi:chemotaxis methyl-accepting protein methylase
VTPPPTAPPVEEDAQLTVRNGFRKILALLRKATGVDFTDYKANTLRRRIARRIVLNKLESMEDYSRLLRENAAEVEALYQDILINVTSFFRNPETFEVLKERIFPRIAEHRAPDDLVRIWSVGCSTGEEAYSIAMSFVEFAGDRGERIPIQVFATDLSDKGIEKARARLYSNDIAEDASPERLRRFFTEAAGDGVLLIDPKTRKILNANPFMTELLGYRGDELRSPLNAMLGWVQLLRGSKLDEAEAERALETVERNAMAQTQLIADLLDVSRIITGKLRIELAPLELIPVIEASL